MHLSTAGAPFDARDRLVIVPTHGAARHLRRTIEDVRLAHGNACLWPDFATPREIVATLGTRLDAGPLLSMAEREVLLGCACRDAAASGSPPPFRLRPALVAEALRFYDELHRHRRTLDDFERLVLGTLEPGADYDRGAERLVRQTRFLVAAFRLFADRVAAHGGDEHRLRAQLLSSPASRPYRHVVVAAPGRAFDRHGVTPADWDLLTRIAGLERLDIVVTDRALAGAPHEWFHTTLPGIEEVRFDAEEEASAAPVMLAPDDTGLVHAVRDREEELADFARRVRSALRDGLVTSIERTALVVQHPLPYLYLGQELFRAASLPYQSADALPLAAEPIAAALDVLVSAPLSGFAPGPVIELSRRPCFDFGVAAGGARASDLMALERRLGVWGYLGGLSALERAISEWEAGGDEPTGGTAALRAARAVLPVLRELEPLTHPSPVSGHLEAILQFWRRHERPSDPVTHGRAARARAAILGLLVELRDAHARFDDTAVPIEHVAELIRRAVESRTFAPAADGAGVHVVDAASAPFGSFALVQLAGLVEGEWPAPPVHDTFYASSLLRELGWPSESDRREMARAVFEDLQGLPDRWLVLSTFTFEMDAPVSPSPFLEAIVTPASTRVETGLREIRIFEHEALSLEPLEIEALAPPLAAVARWRGARASPEAPRFHGMLSNGVAPRRVSPGGLEQYQDCPFAFFSRRILGLEEPPDDGSALSPLARGRLLHDIFHRFLAAWDADHGGPITPDRLPEARARLAEVAEPVLARLPEADRLLERARLYGSAVAIGAVDVLLGFEASRPEPVNRRWLEYAFDGVFTLGSEEGRQLRLRGVADRIDLLADGRLRVIDYKTGRLRDAARALQVPIYALCARERLTDPSGRPRDIAEAGYVTFGDRKPFLTAVAPERADETWAVETRSRVFALLDGMQAGLFPPRPVDTARCRVCAYAVVCRKDYVGGD